MERAWRRTVLLLPLFVACRGPTPGTLVGESAHFRLFVEPALTDVPPELQGQKGLDALEADWADKASMLDTPDGKIDYYLLTPADAVAACSLPETGDVQTGCTWAGTLEIDVAELPHQHELMHAYMDLLARGRVPLSLIAEGAAQSLGCWTYQGSTFAYDPAWQEEVLGVPTTAAGIYAEGGLLARYLIRTQGIDAWVSYYRQAPEVRDPAVFAANFQAFWGVTIDAVWTAMHVPPAGSADMDTTICPCSLPAPGPQSQPSAGFSATQPYWSLPDAAGQAIAVGSFGEGYVIGLQDCAGLSPTILGSPGAPIVTDLPATARWYGVTVAGATVGAYLADDCASTTPYQVSADLLGGAGRVELLAARTSPAASTKYIQVQLPAPTQLMLGYGQEACDTCDFDQGSCQPVTSASTVPVQGTFYLRNQFPALAPGTPNPGTVVEYLQFAN
jgi:hypothetical protein